MKNNTYRVAVHSTCELGTSLVAVRDCYGPDYETAVKRLHDYSYNGWVEYSFTRLLPMDFISQATI